MGYIFLLSFYLLQNVKIPFGIWPPLVVNKRDRPVCYTSSSAETFAEVMFAKVMKCFYPRSDTRWHCCFMYFSTRVRALYPKSQLG